MGKHYLGQFELLNGQILDVEYMRDLFLTHCFREKSNWGILKDILNIMLKEYMTRLPSTKASLIEDIAEVVTQYDYFLGKVDKRTQDAKITESSGKKTFVEFQNRVNTKIPIYVRALQYFALGHSLGCEGVSNQVWFLAENDDKVLRGQVFKNYLLKDEENWDNYPNPSGILFISLKRLARDNSQAGELAALLLGENPAPTDDSVKEIADGFKKHFANFKKDKEVESAMTRLEEERVNAESVGEARGLALGEARKALEIARVLLEKGIPIDVIEVSTGLPRSRIEKLTMLS